MVEGYGILTKQGHRHVLGDDILGFYKDWKDNDEIWSKILPKLEEKLKTELKFNKES